MNYKAFELAALGKLCRECINQQYGVGLDRKDCSYLPNPYPCRCCGEIKNIVSDVGLAGRCKVLLKNIQTKEETDK